METLIDSLITHWMLDPQAFDLVRTGEQSLDAYLRVYARPSERPQLRAGE